MKTPLRYQITEFDCGTVSLINCIIFLFERHEIPAELIKAISTYTLDCYDEHGNLGQKGTSREAVKYLSRWIADFCNSKKLGIKCEYLNGNKVTFERIIKCLDDRGCVNLRTYQECEHYVTITGHDKKYMYLFDPYYQTKDDYKNDKAIICDNKHPFTYNRKVDIERFLSNSCDEFALGPIKKREVVLFNRIK